jgi:hypothetical protein
MTSADRQPGAGPPRQPASDRPLSALPSRQARALAFAAIVVAGACGALIGYSIVSLQCHGSCTTQKGAGSIVGGAIAAIGVAVIAVLVLRAMGEWRTITQQRALDATAAVGPATPPEADRGPDPGDGGTVSPPFPDRDRPVADADRGPPSETAPEAGGPSLPEAGAAPLPPPDGGNGSPGHPDA